MFGSRAVACALCLSLSLCALRSVAEELPVDQKALEKLTLKSGGRTGLTNLLSLEQIKKAIGAGTSSGFELDFSHVVKLLDGSEVDPAHLYGTAYFGPYPFESTETRFVYRRYRRTASITAGKGSLDLAALMRAPYNSEGWTDTGQVGLRFDLRLQRAEKDRHLGIFETVIGFKKGSPFARRPAVIEGPFVNLVHSDRPSEMVLAYVTDREIKTTAVLRKVTTKVAEPAPERSYREELAATRHELTIDELEPATTYRYRIEGENLKTREYQFRTAPASAQASVRLAYLGDTREGVGTGMSQYMGVNFDTLNRLSHIAFRHGADAMLVGGDLVNGYTSVKSDFEAQLFAWKQAMTSFWTERPVYAAMGNHEALLKVFDGARVDLYPYDTDSAEAVFSQIFVHPRNGPQTSDPRRPTYKENVYSFRYGPVLAIAFNNNYWVSYQSEKYGGSPEGYLLADQLDWIEAELERGKNAGDVRYILLYAQEPIFPNGGHVGDSMWHRGDNRVRAHVFRDGKVRPLDDGMNVVRNRFVTMVAANPKVAAVLGSDEHAYHRLLIGKDVPIGDIRRDDRNLNGRIDVDNGETPSKLEGLTHNTWYLVCGGGGAPYYAEQDAPWNEFWRSDAAPKLASGLSGFRYSSQENVLLFDAGPEKIGVKVYNPHGEVIDAVDDLMQDKN